MRIGITLHPYGEKKPAGLGRAILEIVKSILEEDSKNKYTIFLKNPASKPDLPGNNWKTLILTPFAVRRLDVCIFNTPVMPWWYGIFGKAKKSVVIAYDFAYLRKFTMRENPLPNPSPLRRGRGEGWGSNLWVILLKITHFLALGRANLIISISKATKKDLIEIFKIPEEKIKVVCLGYNKICEITPEPIPNLTEKFFLFVGAIKERKNVHGVVEAFLKYKSGGGKHGLVVAGNGQGEYFERIKKISGSNVIFLSQISDAQLSYLYQKAEALMYPSLIEGFGFPVLEAQDCGLPVITSNISSLPEVAGDGAILVDPHNVSEIAEAMKKICQDPNFRQNLIERGRENSKKFSWQKTAQEILKIL